jgi:hypothetical protein
MNKTYYLLKVGNYRYIKRASESGEVSHYDATQKDASRFASVNEALTFITRATWEGNKRAVRVGNTLSYLSANLKLIRIEETTGTETRRELAETELPKLGETVKYGIYGVDGGEWYGEGFCTPLSTVTLYDTQSASLHALQEKVKAKYYSLGAVEIRRVAIKPAEPVIIETELK